MALEERNHVTRGRGEPEHPARTDHFDSRRQREQTYQVSVSSYVGLGAGGCRSCRGIFVV